MKSDAANISKSQFLRAFATMICFVTIPVFGQTKRLSNPQVEFSVDIVDCAGLPCVDAALPDGQRLRLAVDTGNPSSFLSTKAAAKLHIEGQPVLNGDGKLVPGVQKTRIGILKLGSGSLSDLKFLIADVSASIAKGTFPDVDGTVAYGAWMDRMLQLDYSEHKLRYSSVLAAPTPCPADNCGNIRFVTFGKHGPPIVVTDGFSINRHPVSVQVDTMFAGSMLIYPPAARRLGLDALSGSKQMRFFPFTDDGVRMSEAGGVHEKFGKERLTKGGKVYFAGPDVHLPDDLFDGTVGAELLEGHRVTMDFKSMHFWLQ